MGSGESLVDRYYILYINSSMNAKVDIPSIIHEPVVYIIRHAESSGTGPKALITQK